MRIENLALGRRKGIDTAIVALFLFALVIVGGVVVLVYEITGYLNAPKASVTISWGGPCSPINFQVTNNDNKILHGWSVNVEVSPFDSKIVVSPASVPVIALAPQGTYAGSFTLSFSGAPPGSYQLKVNLINSTNQIAASNALTCKTG
ncbi:MAG TPA: hypothetical protein VGR53_04730 [Nitrososphaerales archaeon]|nr:hypothetical protein [Nitrososphaerales archaeon]